MSTYPGFVYLPPGTSIRPVKWLRT
jgi:hypothetical protein